MFPEQIKTEGSQPQTKEGHHSVISNLRQSLVGIRNGLPKMISHNSEKNLPLRGINTSQANIESSSKKYPRQQLPEKSINFTQDQYRHLLKQLEVKNTEIKRLKDEHKKQILFYGKKISQLQKINEQIERRLGEYEKMNRSAEKSRNGIGKTYLSCNLNMNPEEIQENRKLGRNQKSVEKKRKEKFEGHSEQSKKLPIIEDLKEPQRLKSKDVIIVNMSSLISDLNDQILSKKLTKINEKYKEKYNTTTHKYIASSTLFTNSTIKRANSSIEVDKKQAKKDNSSYFKFQRNSLHTVNY